MTADKGHIKHELLVAILLLVVFCFGMGAGVFFEQKKIFERTVTSSVNSSIVNHIIALSERQSRQDSSFNQAIELKSGYEAQSNFFIGNDSDFYFFQVNEPSNVRISFKDIPNEYSMDVYDANKKLVASSLRMGFTASAGLIKILKSGKYYIKVSTNKPLSSKLPYSINVTVLPIFDEGN